MKISLPTKKIALIALVAFFTTFAFSSNPVYAEVSHTSYTGATRKALLTSLYKCYDRGGITDTVEKLSTFKEPASLGKTNIKVPMPSGQTPLTGLGGGGEVSLNCKSLLGGDEIGIGTEDGSFEGLLTLANKPKSGLSKTQKIDVLTGMGYEDVGYTEPNTQIDHCIYFKYDEKILNSEHEITTDNVCAAVDANEKITSFTIDSSTATYAMNPSAVGTGVVTSNFFSEVGGKIRFLRATKVTDYRGYKSYTYKDTKKGIGDSWEDFEADIRQTAATEPSSFTWNFEARGSTVSYTYTLKDHNSGSAEQNETGDSRYEFLKLINSDGYASRAQKAGDRAIKYFSGGEYSKFKQLAFSDSEKIEYYVNVLRYYYFKGVDPNNYWACDVADWNNYSAGFSKEIGFNIFDGIKGDCRINVNKMNSNAKGKTVWGFYRDPTYNLSFFGGSGLTFDDVCDWLSILVANTDEEELPEIEDPPITAPDNPGGTNPGGGTVNPDPGQTTPQDPCYENAGALGWILCPVIYSIENVMDKVYSWIESNFLLVNASIFDTAGANGSGLYQAWDMFRNFGNIAFVIFLLMVIFSQITGVGIDNYGIKRTLPRIIIGAILANLSFIILALCADMSNLLGNSLNSMLTNSFGITSGIGASTGSVAGSFFLVGGLTVAGIVAAFFVNPGLIITVLLLLLTAVIAILFLWITLVTRQAAVIISIVIAPVALVCYMLPNTERWFKKYITLVGALLMLYPICGLVIGGGRFTGTVLSNIGTNQNIDALNLAAMIIQVIPYFFIPSLLRRSMSAMGNIGARLQNAGHVLDRNTTGRIRDADATRRLQTRMQAGMNSRGELTRAGEWRANIARRTGFGRNAIARAQSATKKQREEDITAGSVLMGSAMDAQESRDPASVSRTRFQQQLNEAVRNGNEEDYYALMDESIRRFGASKAADMYRESISGAGQYGNGLMSTEHSAKFLRDSSKRYGDKFQAKDYALGKYMQMGGLGGEHADQRQDLTTFESDNVHNLPVGDIKDEQAATLNSNSIKRAMDTGYATRAMAQRIMASKDMRRGMDDVQQLQWAALAEHNMKLTKDEATQLLSGGPAVGTIDATEATRLIQPLPEDVNVVGGSVGVSGGTVTVDGGSLDIVHNVEEVQHVNDVTNVSQVQEVQQVRNVEQVQNVHQVENLSQVQNVHQVQNVSTVQNVDTVQNVTGTVDVNIADVNTHGNPQTQPLEVKVPILPRKPKPPKT